MSEPLKIIINQSVAVLIDGNNIEMSLQGLVNNSNALANFDTLIPKLLQNRGLSRLIYFREGKSISDKLAERLLNQFHGSVIPCHKSADIPLTIKATQIAQKVDTIIILSGDSDYVELVRHLRGEGVRVEIAAVEATTARILIEEADLFTPITKEDCYILKSYSNKSTGKSTPTKRPAQRKTAVKKTNTGDAGQSAPVNISEKQKSTAPKTNTATSQDKKSNSKNIRENKASTSKASVKRAPVQKKTSKSATVKKTAKPKTKKKPIEEKPILTEAGQRKTIIHKIAPKRISPKTTAEKSTPSRKRVQAQNPEKQAETKKQSTRKTIIRRVGAKNSVAKKGNDGSKSKTIKK